MYYFQFGYQSQTRSGLLNAIKHSAVAYLLRFISKCDSSVWDNKKVDGIVISWPYPAGNSQDCSPHILYYKRLSLRTELGSPVLEAPQLRLPVRPPPPPNSEVFTQGRYFSLTTKGKINPSVIRYIHTHFPFKFSLRHKNSKFAEKNCIRSHFKPRLTCNQTYLQQNVLCV